MARKRHKKWKHPHDQGLLKGEIHVMNDLEEDLRIQRIRQKDRLEKKRQELESQQHLPTDDVATGVDETDSGAEIPSPSQASALLPQHWMIQNQDSLRWPCYIPRISSLWGPCLVQQSPGFSSHLRSRLGNWTLAKHLLEHTKVNSRASTMYNKKIKWVNHVLPNEMNCAWDLTCKHHLHPSARTMDVAFLHSTSANPSSLESGTEDPSYDYGELPVVATTLQGGWGLHQPSILGRENQIHTLRCKPVYAIRMHEKSQKVGAIVRNDHDPTSYKFHWYSLPYVANYIEANLETPVHDFCFGTDLAVFACPRFGGRNGRNALLTPLFLPLDHPSSAILRSLNVQNFPQSDALRVEMSCSKEKFLAFGHRNGQVSLLDLRQSQTCCAIISPEGTPTELGSATDLAFLSSQTQLLVKRSFGPCQLHDLRKLSPCPSSLLQTLTVPEQENGDLSFDKMLSSNCNGFCVDPMTEQILISPFVNTKRQPCLGVWSLKNGDMVGHKVLYENPKQELFFTELCSKTTPAYETSQHHRDGRKVISNPSWFGVWMKCGRFSKENLNSRVGSLHHLQFPGRWIQGSSVDS